MKKIIGYFCGTGYYFGKDVALSAISNAVADNYPMFNYDGCQVLGGGIFAYGVKEHAEEFINELKAQLEESEEPCRLNLIGHSRGAISAEWVVTLIQADPKLRKQVKVTLDLRDPVSGNLQITSQLAGDFAASNWVHDLSDCQCIEKVFITLQEKPILPLAFDALVSKFHPDTKLEIETLPGYHDVQQRDKYYEGGIEHRALLQLGNAKSLAILQEDGYLLKEGETELKAEELKKRQIDAYDELTEWAKKREIPFGERDLHFNGKINANNYERKDLEAMNWRHAHLKHTLPRRILYGTSQINYNSRKSAFEHACDLFMVFDKIVETRGIDVLSAAGLRDILVNHTVEYLHGNETDTDYRQFFKNLFQERGIYNTELEKAINYLCLKDYFKKIDQAILDMPHETALFESIQTLKKALSEELIAAIESGKRIEQIENSATLKIASNTVTFLQDFYNPKNASLEKGVELCNQFARENIILGRDWQLGSKIIVGVLLSVAAVAMGAIIGAAIGIGAGALTGAITGPGAFISAFVAAFYGAVEGAALAATCTGAAVGLGFGAWGSYQFFSPSKTEQLIHDCADTAKSQLLS